MDKTVGKRILKKYTKKLDEAINEKKYLEELIKALDGLVKKITADMAEEEEEK